ASMGALLLAAGAHGKRYALPHSKAMVHQVSSGFEGTAIDIDIQAREILRTNEQLAQILQKHTGQSYERIKNDIQRDYWMTAQESVDYGLVDHVFTRDR